MLLMAAVWVEVIASFVSMTYAVAPASFPTAYVPPGARLPQGKEGGYPCILFPWKSGCECPEGYGFYGMLEFCRAKMIQKRGPFMDTGFHVLQKNASGAARIFRALLFVSSPGNVHKLMLYNDGTKVTNLHTHGLHIVRDGNGDDVIRKANGGKCLDYTWDLSGITQEECAGIILIFTLFLNSK